MTLQAMGMVSSWYTSDPEILDTVIQYVMMVPVLTLPQVSRIKYMLDVWA